MAPFFTLFGRTVGSYGLCSVFGLLVSSFVAIRLGRRQGFPIYPVIQAAVAALVGLLAGGHLLYGLLHLPRLLAQLPRSCFCSCFSGSVYYGGFLGSLVLCPLVRPSLCAQPSANRSPIYLPALSPYSTPLAGSDVFWVAAAMASPADGALPLREIRWCRR